MNDFINKLEYLIQHVKKRQLTFAVDYFNLEDSKIGGKLPKYVDPNPE